MDPGEDIIDVLYNTKPEAEVRPRRPTLESRPQSSPFYLHQYGFDYHHPPSRNYYEDLHQIQRRHFHGSDSVYGTHQPLCRTDSVPLHQVNSGMSSVLLKK